ncbi:hypothetical protein [Streptomyces prasinopilosus]|uniref:Uncharacterized protein n=1 Tax=Streptomyces prasinopilosus TaxID=67344 RepID=A0A1G6ME35_9ACTN|nr:hypothetical protein [Streptomyces prasinopilosus]SDC53215.1 hypothetical protein SAMN05216505_102474 [Streptomyces prasinopilosus]
MKAKFGLAASAILVVGGMGLTVAPASAAPTAPTAQCSVVSAGIGQFQLVGSGFKANAPVNVLKNGALQAVATADGAGAFTVGAVRGNYTAVDHSGNSAKCSDPFTTTEEEETEIGQGYTKGFTDGQAAGKKAAKDTMCGTPQIPRNLRQDAYADGFRDGFTRGFDSVCAQEQGQGNQDNDL